jgi:hypothetical protein
MMKSLGSYCRKEIGKGLAAEATAVKELPAHWVQAIPPRPKNNPRNKSQRGFLPASDRYNFYHRYQQILLALIENTEWEVSSRFRRNFFQEILSTPSQPQDFTAKLCARKLCPLVRKSMTVSITGLKQETTAQMAQRICAEQFAAILIQEPDVRLGEVEAIHDMRVATRRLRVTLINFAACWSKLERQQLKSWLQNLADALGEVRDLDVLMDALKPKLNQSAVAERPLMTNLIERLRQQRKRRFQALLVFLDSEAYLRSKDEVSCLLALPKASPVSPETNG